MGMGNIIILPWFLLDENIPIVLFLGKSCKFFEILENKKRKKGLYDEK